jgi:hypothetical protein
MILDSEVYIALGTRMISIASDEDASLWPRALCYASITWLWAVPFSASLAAFLPTTLIHLYIHNSTSYKLFYSLHKRMSGALETAAGTFAIVGVADVVVRTGRELYHFLCEVSDASDEVKRLNECIWDTILLVDALRNCAQANVDVGIVASVQAAVRALHRELQSLKLVLAKFKGAKTAWSRIKYALDEKKVSKALTSLERSKSLLVNSLTIIYG